jgi:hypothetical protein
MKLAGPVVLSSASLRNCTPSALSRRDDVITILHDQPVLRGIAREARKAELLVELPRSRKIFYGQADREIAEFHDVLHR